MSLSIRKIGLVYGGVKHSIEIDVNEPVEIFKYQVYSITGVPVEHQKIVGFKGGILKNNTDLSTLNIPNDKRVILVGTREKKAPSLQNSTSSPFVVHPSNDKPQQTVNAEQLAKHEKGKQSMASKLENTSLHVMQYEIPSIQEKARKIVPIEELKRRAEKNEDALPSFEDELLRQLMLWFKNEFFKWVDQPPCDFCMGKTRGVGSTGPNPEEQYYQASVVELYSCTLCGTITRFPRYNHPEKLLDTRRGRCGEWANCFTLLCRALGYDARYVLDFTDHVWTEVYSSQKGKWCHVDPCEAAYDRPLLYEVGWGKKLNYIIAFSNEEVIDVTKRYTKKWAEILTRRDMVPENWLQNTIQSLDNKKKGRIPATRKEILTARRKIELEEMEKNIQTQASPSAEEMHGRVSGSTEWKQQRGELGSCASTIPQQVNTSDFKTLFDFPNFSQIGELIFVGDSILVENKIRLTSAKPSQTGAIWYKSKLPYGKGFETQFTFQITNPGADGFAFVLHGNSNTNIIGSDGCQLGYGGIKSCIAIEFDTYQSYDRTQDPNGNHISIHTRGEKPNSADHDYSIGCNVNLPSSLNDGKIHSVKVTYLDQLLRVFMDDTPILQVSISLKDKLKLDDQRIFAGFTAATGGLFENHDILRWSWRYKQ